MEFSTNLPRTLQGYDAIEGVDGHKLASNVSAEADVAFMSALKREDPDRVHCLQRNLERAAGSAKQRARYFKTCAVCHGRFRPMRSDAETCSAACRKQRERLKAAV
jgi:hypothetical protein